MTDIFISYKREDEARVVPIVEGLKSAGLAVWWDREISGGASWRQSISEALQAARCVIVVWSELSVGPPGEFVRDEAGRAKARGVLVPVRIDPVTEPLGFGEIQSLDLVGWRGNVRDLRFQNLVDAVKAVVSGGPRPRPRVPGRRARLLAAWGSGLTLAATALVFTTNLVGLQKPLCKIPGVHAMCVSLGLGGVATKEEEALWSARAAGDCEGLRTYLERFPNGHYAEQANRRIDAAETVEEESWTPEELPLPLVVRAALDPLASEEAARADALTRGAEDAADLCEGYNAGEFRGVSPPAVEVKDWRCSARGSGSVCGFDGKAICKVEARRVTQRKVCK